MMSQIRYARLVVILRKALLGLVLSTVLSIVNCLPLGALAKWGQLSLAFESVPTSYNLNYDISESGTTQVEIRINLFNPNQDVYISDYTLFINESDLKNVQARDGGGLLKPIINKTPDGTEINLKVNQKVVGVEKPLSLLLNYESLNIAKKNGRVWEVILPKIGQENKLQDFEVNLNVPLSFGEQIFVSPAPSLVEKKLSKISYNFNDKNVASTGAILSFGPYQIYGLDLTYHLKNPQLWNAVTKIALPPSLLNEQLVVLDLITPIPDKMDIDPDGNHLAIYNLSGGQSLTVHVKGRAKVYNPNRDVSLSGSFSEIPISLKKEYLGAQKYWEVSDPKIKETLTAFVPLITPESQVSQVAQKLFQKTVALLKYDPSRITPDLKRFGAKQALDRPLESVCMEFSDLYITLLRQAGIPAQLLEGYALTSDFSSRPAIGDVLHSWVRLYLPRVGWVSVDPTWADTTAGLDFFSQLDTNHFTFVVKGLSSEFPYPAGAYKISPDQVNDIQVEVLKEKDDFNEPTSLISYKYSQFGLVSPTSKSRDYELSIKNDGKTSIFSLTLNLQGKSLNLGDLPPLGESKHQFRAVVNPTENQPLANASWLNQKNKVENLALNFKRSQVKTLPFGKFSENDSFKSLKIILILGLCSSLAYFLIVRATPRQ